MFGVYLYDLNPWEIKKTHFIQNILEIEILFRLKEQEMLKIVCRIIFIS